MSNIHPSFGLSRETIKKLLSVLHNISDLQRAIIYGSRAMGNFRPGSDIDLCLEAPGLTSSDLLKLVNDIDELNLPYKVDVCLLHQIDNKELLEHILRIGKPLPMK